MNCRPGRLQLSVKRGLLAACLLLLAGNVHAVIDVGLVIESDTDSNGNITVVKGGKIKVSYTVIEDTNKDLHKNDKIQLLRVADNSLVSSVKRGKKKSRTVSLPVAGSENEQLYVHYVRKGPAGEVVATVSKPGDPGFVPLQSIPKAKLDDLTVRINAVEPGVVRAQNLLLVSPAGTDFSSVQAAIDSIDDASDSNRYLVKIGPGSYNEDVTMKEFVDIEGSGQLRTTITSTASSIAWTLLGASNAELRNLTIESRGLASNNYAMRNQSGSSPRLINVTLRAFGGNQVNLGIFSSQSSSPFLRNVTVTATGGSSAVAFYQVGTGSAELFNVSASASGASTTNQGLYRSTSGEVIIKGGRFAGSSNSILHTNAITRVVGTQLDGPAVNTGAGTLKCLFSFDDSYAELNASCQ